MEDGPNKCVICKCDMEKKKESCHRWLTTSLVCLSLALSVCSMTYSWSLSRKLEGLRRTADSPEKAELRENEVHDTSPEVKMLFAKKARVRRSYVNTGSASVRDGDFRGLLLDNIGAQGASPTRATIGTSLDITASHFVSKGMLDPEIKQQFTGKGVHCIAKWEGNFCSNNTFWSTVPDRPVEFLSTADWMKAHQQRSLPLTLQSHGQFVTNKDGLYLIYLNVLIQATKIAHAIDVYIDGERKLDCRETLDYIRPHSSGQPYQYARGKTCSVSAVFYLTKGQVISIKLTTANTIVVLKPENTNFGAVCLSQV